jgi:hypothetical protein
MGSGDIKRVGLPYTATLNCTSKTEISEPMAIPIEGVVFTN